VFKISGLGEEHLMVLQIPNLFAFIYGAYPIPFASVDLCHFPRILPMVRIKTAGAFSMW
jgi:hypothetical protein